MFAIPIRCSTALEPRPMPEYRYRAAKIDQCCLDVKSVSICGCGGTSDMTCATSNDGQGSAAEDGSPLAAKFAQAVRMLAASASWSMLNGTWIGASERSKRYARL